MMNVMIMAQDPAALADLNQVLCSDPRMQIVTSWCTDLKMALRLFSKNQSDVIVLDLDGTDQGGFNRLKLADRIRRNNPKTEIIFLSSDSTNAMAAYGVYPLDYLIKPIQKSRLRQTFDRALCRSTDHLGTDQSVYNRRLNIRCFGRFEVASGFTGKEPVRLPTKKCRELLAYLLAHPDQPISKDQLLENLFDSRTDEKTVNQLHVTVYKLRQAIQPYNVASQQGTRSAKRNGIRIMAVSGHYQIDIEDGQCDLVDLIRYIRQPFPIDAQRIEEAERIAALYAGPCFEREEYIWAEDLQASFDIAYEQLLLQIADFHESRNHPQQMEKTLKKLVQINPFSEEGHYALLDLYLQRKEPRKFVRQYEMYQQVLTDELGATMDLQYQKAYKQMRSS